jgi:hypothetical protein
MRDHERVVLFVAVAIASLALAYLVGHVDATRSAWDRHTTEIENAKCSLRGLQLLRGQLGEYVCVMPGSERGRRKP